MVQGLGHGPSAPAPWVAFPLRGGGSAARGTPRRHGPNTHGSQGPSRKPDRGAWACRASCPCGSAW
eukprot:3858686-Pyramimonas_sp.AAC.1